jgi:hypothetical protein
LGFQPDRAILLAVLPPSPAAGANSLLLFDGAVKSLTANSASAFGVGS